LGAFAGGRSPRLAFDFHGSGSARECCCFAAFFLIHEVMGFITREVFHSRVDYHRINQLTLPVILLISLINPVFEETIESGYIFHALQRHGMWLTVLASAGFRAFLHATMGMSGVVTMFVQGLLYGFLYWRWRQLWPLIIAHALQMLYSLLRTMEW
jgi:membrane protease YdiL (CAAX protease family)